MSLNIEQIFQHTAEGLKDALCSELVEIGYNTESIHSRAKFLYAEGDTPYMLVAHLDTVHKSVPSIICYSKSGHMMSPQGIGGDDRCGVYIILSLLQKLPFKPYVLFTMEEEIGGWGASSFNSYIHGNPPSLKYIVEFDRKGKNDCVFYNCDNAEFTAFVEQFGFKTAWGTFTDISLIAPKLGVAAVNLSCGYYNPHLTHEYVSLRDVKKIIEMSYNMLTSECGEFKYVPKKYAAKKPSYNYSRNETVTFLPANTVYSYGKVWNIEHEIAVDRYGNLYRYNRTYKDLVFLSARELKDAHIYFDAANSEILPVLGY